MENTHGYLESWSREIQSTANTVRDLIGSVHWLSDGHHRETVLRDFISRYVPNSVSVDSGFVKPAKHGSSCSREIDILISNLEAHSPYYSRGGLKIIPPHSLLACVEVKSEWSKAKLREALNNTASTKLITRQYCPSKTIWSGVCFFGALKAATLTNLPSVAESAIRETVIPALIASGVEYPNENDVLCVLPTCIFNLENFVLYFSTSSEPGCIDLRLFRTGNTSPAYALIDMFDSIRSRVCGVASDDLSSMVGSSDALAITRIKI